MEASERVWYWLPRILCILAILFISMFAADSFAPGLTIWQQLGAFFLHLIPSFILTAILLVAWKWEFVGGIVFILVGIALSPPVFMLNYRMNQSFWISLSIILMITIPFVVVGVLFLVNQYLKKKQANMDKT